MFCDAYLASPISHKLLPIRADISGMTISFTASGNDVLFAGTVHTTEKSAEAAAEQAAKLNDAFKRVLSESNGDEPDTKGGPGVDADDSQFVPMGTGKQKSDDMDDAESASKKDPDNDGDDDTNAKGDTDHDYWTAGGKQKKALPGKPLPKEKSKDFNSGERKKDAKAGVALPDGSFPIESVADLKNAVQAFGRAKDKVAAKAHIKKRAAALGSTDALPDSW